MKKLYFIIASLFIINFSVAQKLLHLFPEVATQNSSLFLDIQGHFTNFNSSDSNLVILTNNVDTIEKWAHYQYGEELYLSVYFLNGLSNTGYYDLYLYNNIDDTLFLKNAIYITSHILEKNTDAPYNYQNNTISTITVQESNSHFISGGDLAAFLVNNTNDTLKIHNIYAPTEDSLTITFKADSSKHGIYNLFTYTALDNIAYVPNILNIKNSRFTQIDSVSPDTLITYNLGNPYTLYGHKTHFTQDSCIIYTGIELMFPIRDIIIVNDSLITFLLEIPIVCKDIKPETFMFYIYNDIDGKMSFISKVFLGGSINNSAKNTNIKLFPNPISNGEFTLEFDQILKQNLIITIYNEIGQQLKSEQLSDGIKTKTINISEISQGIYFYSISNNSGQINAGKFIIQ